jgi:hypothetical protein
MPSHSLRTKPRVRLARMCLRLPLALLLATGALFPLNASAQLPLNASAQLSTGISGPLYGSIPNVTIDGIPSGGAPWVVRGHVSFGAGRVTATSTGLFIAAGYTSTGAPVPTKLVGTTGGVTSVSIEVRDTTGGSYLSSPLALSAAGSFSFSAPVQLSAPIADPIVLVGIAGNGGSLKAWIAASDFLADFGQNGSPAPTPPSHQPPSHQRSTTLEAIGAPTQKGGYCGAFVANVHGSNPFTIAGVTYQNGVQFGTRCGEGPTPPTTYSWHVGGAFATLTALVGLDESSTMTVTLSFLSSDGEPLPFFAGGSTVTQLNVEAGLPTLITVGLSHAQAITIQTEVPGAGTGSIGTLDFANDKLIYA